jgi:hypothetical protein
LTLLIVLIGTYVQQASDRRFRLREHFLAGLNIIGQYDTNQPGCEQALRFLDYYARVALELKDKELLLLLNAVITKDIRSRLEALDKEKQRDIYVYAREAKRQLADLLRDHHMARKGVSQCDD